jgi:hypothetical protein
MVTVTAAGPEVEPEMDQPELLDEEGKVMST